VLYQGTSKYDVENHLVSYQVSPAVPATIQYAWGLDGHLATLSGDPSRKGQSGYSPGDESLTWDGDQLLFTANSNLQVDDIKIGTLADITIPSSGSTPASLVVWDRELNGAQTSCHTATAKCPWAAPSGSLNYNFLNAYSTNRDQYGLTFLTSPLTDGLSDGYNVFHGDRVEDSVLGQWTSPDSDPGNLDDPLSQKAYAIRGNNRERFMDPTGNYVQYILGLAPATPVGYRETEAATQMRARSLMVR
jgi:hypothetical protein